MANPLQVRQCREYSEAVRLTLCKLCQLSSRLESGNPVLVGIFSRMHNFRFPTALDPCFLAVEIECDAFETGRQYRLEFRMIDEDGAIRHAHDGVLDLPPSPDPYPKQTQFEIRVPWREPMVFERSGIFRFDVVVYRDEEEDILGGTTLVVHG